MRSTTTLLSAALLAAAILGPMPSTAQVPQMMNYQVMLTDNANQPLADQGVQLVFRVYDDASAGVQQWTETHNVTTNSIGVVSVILGETTPLPTASFDGPLWLEVQANGEILLPRRRLVSAPYALHAIESDSASGAGDGYSLDASDGSPVDAVYVNASGNVGIGTTTPTRDVHVHRSGAAYEHFTSAATGATLTDGLVVGTESDGTTYVWNYENQELVLGSNNQTMVILDPSDAVRIGNSYSWTGELEVHRLGVATPQIACSSNAYGGNTTFSDEAGNTTVLVAADDNGTGGLIRVARDATYSASEGIELNGNWAGTEAPALRVLGPDRSATLNMSVAGNSSVTLPTDAIGSAEMLNEPGIGHDIDLWGVILTGGTDIIASRTITVPAAGYVVIIGSCGLRVIHTTGTTSYAGVAIGSSVDQSSSYYELQSVDHGASSGLYDFAVAAHGAFRVATAGSYTYYFLADEASGSWSACPIFLTVMYFPTAYGTVDETARAGAAPEGAQDLPVAGADIVGAPLTSADITAEQAEAREFHLARLGLELAEIRTELEAMKEEGIAQTPTSAERTPGTASETDEVIRRGPSLPKE
jgi:hypothetical protein